MLFKSYVTTDGRTDILTYSADPRAGQDYSTDQRVVQDSHSDYSADSRGEQ